LTRDAGSGGTGVSPSPLPGRQKLSREFIEAHRRRRVVQAFATLAQEKRAGEISTAEICAAARMARNTFYGLFGSMSNFRRVAFGEAFDSIFGPVRAASEAEDEWLAKLQAAVGAFFEKVAAEPELASLCLVHSVAATEEAEGCDYQTGIEMMTGVMGAVREAARLAGHGELSNPPAQTEEYLGGMIVSLATLRLQQGEAASLPRHRDEMAMLVAISFLGPEEATRAWDGLGAAAPLERL
jgi:AcrR family transcriptional regulator